MKEHLYRGRRRAAAAPKPAAPAQSVHSPTLQALKPGPDLAKALEALPAIFDDAVPLTQKHRLELGRTIRSLWEDLTSEREHRTAEYLSAPAYYSAYVRYFLPWNIIRLASIFSELPLKLEEGATIVDIGSGPLTLPLALYVTRPNLRQKRLTIYCTDKTERILKVGQTIFESLCVRLSGGLPPWKIVTLRQQFGIHPPEKADLVTGANVFNEFFWKSKSPLGMRALLTARQLLGYLKDSGSVFLMEPGDPRSGSFISSMRAALLAFGALPVAPCPHAKACPMPGIFHSLETPGVDLPSGAETKTLEAVVMPRRREKYPWCHFNIGASSAPAWLKKLSDDAGLPKEKLVFSYLLSTVPDMAALAGKPGKEAPLLRIVSEEFPLPQFMAGRYACSPEGYCLVRYSPIRTSFSSGDLLRLPLASAAPRALSASAFPAQKSRPGGPGTHFAGLIEGRGQASPGAPGRSRDMDEKSGAIIVSY